MKFSLTILTAILLNLAISGIAAERETVILKGETATVVFDLGGGSIVDFHLKDNPVNPLTWHTPPEDDTTPQSAGHFICFGRLGRPSKAEQENGMPNHGEAAHVHWEVLDGPTTTNTEITATVKCTLPIGGMTLTRHMRLSRYSSVLAVTDTVRNINLLGRFYNLVQHPSIAAPFLNATVRVDTNGWKGFTNSNPMPHPDEPVIYWPHIVFEKNLFDLRYITRTPRLRVTSFRFPDETEQGWITAGNANQGVLIGYVWDTAEYPWVRVWRNFADNAPIALGTEFGTTPLQFPFRQILEHGDVFDTQTIRYIDADEEQVYSFTVLLAPIPANWNGVYSVTTDGDMLTVTEDVDENPRSITMPK